MYIELQLICFIIRNMHSCQMPIKRDTINYLHISRGAIVCHLICRDREGVIPMSLNTLYADITLLMSVSRMCI